MNFELKQLISIISCYFKALTKTTGFLFTYSIWTLKRQHVFSCLKSFWADSLLKSLSILQTVATLLFGSVKTSHTIDICRQDGQKIQNSYLNRVLSSSGIDCCVHALLETRFKRWCQIGNKRQVSAQVNAFLENLRWFLGSMIRLYEFYLIFQRRYALSWLVLYLNQFNTIEFRKFHIGGLATTAFWRKMNIEMNKMQYSNLVQMTANQKQLNTNSSATTNLKICLLTKKNKC